jgi:RecJ-like exonuclease
MAACQFCSGRGFKWKTGKILSRHDGSEIAKTYQQGETCQACQGSGEQPIITIQLKQALTGAALLIIPVFGIIWFLLHL